MPELRRLDVNQVVRFKHGTPHKQDVNPERHIKCMKNRVGRTYPK